jgi:hypothetical protein
MDSGGRTIMYKINPYGGVILDQIKFIPEDPANTDWIQFQAWLTEGNTPIPEDQPFSENSFDGQ